jgi:hypothetical protein
LRERFAQPDSGVEALRDDVRERVLNHEIEVDRGVRAMT